jgi:putative transposase
MRTTAGSIPTTAFRSLITTIPSTWGTGRCVSSTKIAFNPARVSAPTAAWALQQLREALGYEDRYHYLIHDRDGIFAKSLDESIGRLGLKVLKSPLRSPMANSICERAIGTIRRECLDWLIPMSEAHLRAILKDWRTHYNRSRPHMALGPSFPDPPVPAPVSKQNSRYRLGERLVVRAQSILGGLHHEYSLAPTPA